MAEPADPSHAIAFRAVDALIAAGERVCLAPQNVTEFWSVATRPRGSANGLGMSVELVGLEVRRLIQVFELLPETDSIFPIWLRLVSDHGISGVHVHDARLVACMEANGIENLVTFNLRDFRSFTEIRVASPEKVAPRVS
jgi:predicted nucleic acid-binding protein